MKILELNSLNLNNSFGLHSLKMTLKLDSLDLDKTIELLSSRDDDLGLVFHVADFSLIYFNLF